MYQWHFTYTTQETEILMLIYLFYIISTDKRWYKEEYRPDLYFNIHFSFLVEPVHDAVFLSLCLHVSNGFIL